MKGKRGGSKRCKSGCRCGKHGTRRKSGGKRKK